HLILSPILGGGPDFSRLRSLKGAESPTTNLRARVSGAISVVLSQSLVAFPALSSGLLFDTAKVDLPDKRLRDEVERVNLRVHQNISYLQRMLGKKLAVG